MPDPSNEQELEYETILPTVAVPGGPEPESKGYEYYAKKAAADAEAAEAAEATPSEGAGETPEVVVPDKFKGKTPEQIIESYTQLEQEFGRRGNEIGNLRRINDELLELKTAPAGEKTPSEPAKVEVDSLLEDPDKVIKEAVENNPRLTKIEQSLEANRIREEKAAFESKHPKWQEQLQGDTNFHQWIAQNPIVQDTLVKANAAFDYNSITQVYDMYAQTQGTRVDEAKQSRNASARQSVADQTQIGRGSEAPSKKGIKRSEIIELRMKHPAEYERRKAEITAAYHSGRVINDL